jgi:hypothetical protein
MKTSFITLSVLLLCFHFSFAQQVINTNQKSNCTLQENVLQGCSDETFTSSLTINENLFSMIHHLSGSDVNYTIESKVFENPYWSYRITNTESGTMTLKVDHTAKEFIFYPLNPVNGSPVTKYKFN